VNDPSPIAEIADASRRAVQSALEIGANRLELLALEAQEARERLLQAFLLSLGVAVFGLLAGITLSCGIVLLLWPYSPVITLAILTLLYAGASVFLFARLNRIRYEWPAFADSLDQLRKDCECLANTLR
jgi:uncharacterized membrane protein YqjE